MYFIMFIEGMIILELTFSGKALFVPLYFNIYVITWCFPLLFQMDHTVSYINLFKCGSNMLTHVFLEYSA
jgi:hypothetical protein